ncbi:hypothetical protein 2 [Kummerowia striatad enamovirus]|uniref:RNA-directed RNA polymerase n=1 Tax=Kummerowia striatad enamovirus TaxID=2738918 RepID=A0A6M6RFS3_9VIRU|nr:hypothetical protein 2 [Kummerowia striatad enamovirus]
MRWEAFLQELAQCLHEVEPTAGSGVPYVGISNRRTHHDWIHDPEMMPVVTALVWIRLEKLSKLGPVELAKLSPEDCVRQGLVDPVRVFVKGEPHKRAKLRDKRYRLIMSVSLVDQLVARMLFRSQNRKELALFRAIPSQPGMGLSTDEQVQDFVARLGHKVRLPVDEVCNRWREFILPTDCSGFDWSVQEWMLQDDMEVRNRLTKDCPDILKRMRASWLHCLANSVLMLSDGVLLAQETAGIQKSGSYNTSSSNSRIRFLCALYAGASWALTMGDDALEDCQADLSVYKRLGLKVEPSETLEFCSHRFESPRRALPTGVGKMLFKLLHSYDPASADLECLLRYDAAMYGVLQELRHLDAAAREGLCLFLAIPEEQKRAGR